MEKPIPTKISRPINTGADIVLKRLEFLAITRNLFKARGTSCVKDEIGFVCHWLKNWCDIYSQNSRRSCRNYAITVESHLKPALYDVFINENTT